MSELKEELKKRIEAFEQRQEESAKRAKVREEERKREEAEELRRSYLRRTGRREYRP